MKKVAIITINFNNLSGLKKTMDSVFSQDGRELEYIVIDGGSSDGSREWIEEQSEKLAYWVSEKDQGIYHAQNKGLEKAEAEYCLFLNSGDILANDKVISAITPELGSADIVYGDLITSDAQGKETYVKSADTPDVYHFMISTLWHPTAFIKREIFGKLGGYDQTLKVTGDYEFFIRAIIKNNASTKHINRPICIFDLKGISNSPEMAELQTLERKKSWELNFSPKMIETFEEHTRLLRSREYKLAKLLKRILKPFKSRG